MSRRFESATFHKKYMGKSDGTCTIGANGLLTTGKPEASKVAPAQEDARACKKGGTVT